MSYFTRFRKADDDRGWDGSFARRGQGAPPPHLRDKNGSHSGQGASASVTTQEGDLASQQANGDESDFQPYDDLDTTDQ